MRDSVINDCRFARFLIGSILLLKGLLPEEIRQKDYYLRPHRLRRSTNTNKPPNSDKDALVGIGGLMSSSVAEAATLLFIFPPYSCSNSYTSSRCSMGTDRCGRSSLFSQKGPHSKRPRGKIFSVMDASAAFRIFQRSSGDLFQFYGM